MQVQAWMIIPTSNSHFGSPLEGHMRPFDLTFTFGLPPSVWGSIGESPRLWRKVEGHLWRCQAGRPKSGRLAWQGRIGDFCGGLIFPSGLRIGWPSVHFDHLDEIFDMVLSNMWFEELLYHVQVSFFAEMSEWTFICMASPATSPIMVFVHHFTYIPCKTWWDTKLMELISLNRTLYQNFFKFPH